MTANRTTLPSGALGTFCNQTQVTAAQHYKNPNTTELYILKR